MVKKVVGNILTGEFSVEETTPLRDRYTEPPFSVLRGNSPTWMTRKRNWRTAGLKSEEGRDAKLLKLGTIGRDKDGKSTMPEESIFDPALCEILLEWYSAKGDRVFDPFAGGSVRGIVSSVAERHYTGYDCRQEQVDANEKQRALQHADFPPKWIVCDSVKQDFPEFDFMLSCPPYGNLETYSKQQDDISRLTIDPFMEMYMKVIEKAYAAAKPGAFAVFVVGNYRDSKDRGGQSDNFVDFVARTIGAFKAAGWIFFDEIIYLQPMAAAPQRASLLFKTTNKLVRIHQNCLVFCKGKNRTIPRGA